MNLAMPYGKAKEAGDTIQNLIEGEENKFFRENCAIR